MIFTTDQIARTLGGNEDDIHVGARIDAAVEDREAVREQQGHALGGERLDDVLVDFGVAHIRGQDGDDGGVSDRVLDFGGLQAVMGGLVIAGTALADADDDVSAGIAEVLGMGAALAAVTDDGDTFTLQAVGRNVVIGIDLHSSLQGMGIED